MQEYLTVALADEIAGTARATGRHATPPSIAGRLPTDEEAWTAVVERDRSWDGRLLYAVATTGVYCRPSCPARRPRRENVVFFASADDAEAGGYRACKRCRPLSAHATGAERAVERARAYLDARLDDAVTLERLAEVAGLSPHHLQRTFKRLVGLSPKAYQDAKRLERFKERLRGGDTVGRATFEAGFGSSRALYEKAEAALGMSPATYRRGGRGASIRYATAQTRFGLLLVAATERGICAVSLGEAAEPLAAELRREFPEAMLTEDSAALAPWVEAIVDHLHGKRPELDLPAELSGTDFQLRVWRALREIPYGDTRTYREVAESIGRPTAARAVARACATNRVALVVPCHRVVREDGSPSGYRWGPERKRRLLEHERSAADAGRGEGRGDA